MQNSDFPNLPRSWQVKTLGEIGEIITGSTPNTKNKEYYGNEYPFYKPTDLNSGYFVENSNDMVSSKGFEISRKLPPKSILVTCIGATIGKTGFIRNAGICNQQINAIVTKQHICPEFVYFYCISNKMQELIKTNASATTLPILNKTAFSKLPIPIPPLEIQKRIVKRLDEAFSRIESGTKHLQSAKNNLTKYKQSLLKSAFNGTLTNESSLSQGESATPSLHSKSIAQSSLRGSNATEAIHKKEKDIDCHESANADSRNDKNSPSLAEGARGWVNPLNDNALDCHADKSACNDDEDSLNGESANLPQGWTIKTLGEIFKVVGGGTPSTAKTEFWNGNIAWITSADIDLQDFTITPKRFITDKAIQSSTTNLVEKDTIIVVTRVGLGKVGITDRQTCFSQDSQALIPLENINLKFMAFQIKNQAKNFIAVSRGTTINGITKSTLKEVKLVIPPLETQKQIVAILDGHFTSADKVSAYIETCLTKAKQLKSSLLKSAFEGGLV